MTSYFEKRMAETSPHQGTKGFVYFISDGEAVKIGFAVNVASRLSTLQTGNHRNLIMQMCFPTYSEAERMLHRHFKASRIAREWFQLTPDMEELWDDLFDYQGSRSAGATGKEFIANLDKVLVEPDDLRLILENLNKVWPGLTAPHLMHVPGTPRPEETDD